MQPPTKWHLARVGVLTWFVGLVSGWMLTAAGAPPSLVVPGAVGWRATCADAGLDVRVEGPEQVAFHPSTRGGCDIEAQFADGTSARTESRVTLRGTQVCRVTGEVLRCASSWP